MKFLVNPLENIWDSLFSRDPIRIRMVFASLSPAEQTSVYTHLRRMVNETGWLPEQQESAQVALQALKEIYNCPPK